MSFHNRKVKNNLDERMKSNYEHAYRMYLPRRMPVIIRLDGKAFHTFTRGMNKPFDINLIDLMQKTMKYLFDNIQNCVLGYTQSDEISLLLMNYKNLNTESWFDNNLQKMVSVSAAMASSYFSIEYNIDHIARVLDFELASIDGTETEIEFNEKYPKYVQFDSRAFVLPESEVNNYFISRQNDCERNAIQMIGQSHYSSKQLHGKSCRDIITMVNNDSNIEKKYEDYFTTEKFGTVCYRGLEGKIRLDTHIFKQGTYFVEQMLEPEVEE